MKLLDLLVMVLVGCVHQGSSQHPVQQEESQQRESSREQARPDEGSESQADDVCSEIRERTAALIEPFRERFEEESGCRPPPSGLGWCRHTSSGTWAIALEELAPNEDDVLEGHWAIVHIDTQGRRAVLRPNVLPPELSEPWNVNFSSSPCYSMLEIDEPTPFDYDSDGSPELILPIAFRAAEEAPLFSGRVWRAQDDSIAPYSGAGDLVVHAVRDVDTDGRPDLVIHEPYVEQSTSCASTFSQMAMGPPLLAHSLDDGTFSTDDDVAKAFARTSCPVAPTRIVARYDEGSVDSDRTTDAIVCARLWGMETAPLVAQLRRECAPPARFARDNECATCSELELYERWAAIEPPLRLQ